MHLFARQFVDNLQLSFNSIQSFIRYIHIWKYSFNWAFVHASITINACFGIDKVDREAHEVESTGQTETQLVNLQSTHFLLLHKS